MGRVWVPPWNSFPILFLTAMRRNHLKLQLQLFFWNKSDLNIFVCEMMRKELVLCQLCNILYNRVMSETFRYNFFFSPHFSSLKYI